MISRTGLVGQDVCATGVCAANAKTGSSVRKELSNIRRALCIDFSPLLATWRGTILVDQT
jgi:hypothetical protein